MGRRDDIEAEMARLGAELAGLPDEDVDSVAEVAADDALGAGADAVESAARAVEHAAAAVEQVTPPDEDGATEAAVEEAQATADAAVDIAVTAAVIASEGTETAPEPEPEPDVAVDVIVPHDTSDTSDAGAEVEHAPQSQHWSNRRWFGGGGK